MYSEVLKGVKPKKDPEDTLLSEQQTCTGCVWRNEDGVTCSAFPEGIPLPILLGAFDHHVHYEDELVTDDGLVFLSEKDLAI
jgi:hypothetical protein